MSVSQDSCFWPTHFRSLWADSLPPYSPPWNSKER